MSFCPRGTVQRFLSISNVYYCMSNFRPGCWHCMILKYEIMHILMRRQKPGGLKTHGTRSENDGMCPCGAQLLPP